jgi:hypothetical protein
VRLPLQIGRASLNQGARYASCVWLGPLFLLLAAMFQSSWGLLAVFGFSIPAIFFAGSAILAAEVARQDRASDIVLAWHVPEYSKPPWDGLSQPCGLGTCGHVANGDPIRRTLTFVSDGKRVETTLLPHGVVSWSCSHGCALELDEASLTPDSEYGTDLRIEHDALKEVTP